MNINKLNLKENELEEAFKELTSKKGYENELEYFQLKIWKKPKRLKKTSFYLHHYLYNNL